MLTLTYFNCFKRCFRATENIRQHLTTCRGQSGTLSLTLRGLKQLTVGLNVFLERIIKYSSRRSRIVVLKREKFRFDIFLRVWVNAAGSKQQHYITFFFGKAPERVIIIVVGR